MTRAGLLQFLRGRRYAVQSSVSPDGAPQAAVVGIAVSEQFEIVFDTIDTTRKARNLRRDGRIALVFGSLEPGSGETVQYEGIADRPTGSELQRLIELYLSVFPDGRERQKWPGLTYVRATASWLRYSEAARVLAPGGVLAIYDFSAARRLPDSDALDEWYASFELRYPSPPGYHLDPRGLAYAPSGLWLEAYEEMEVAVGMTLSSYLRYAMTETNVELAISRGVPEPEIVAWCRRTLEGIFGDDSREVICDAYVACVKRATP